MRIALLTYSTKPRGGVVHTLALAEALAATGAQVDVWTLARGGDAGFFRTVDRAVGLRMVHFADLEDESVGQRIMRSISTLRAAFTPREYDIVHAQDCISANAVDKCVRTIHHLDTFTTPELITCHERAIVAPYAHICVSSSVAREVEAGWHITPTVISNGIDAARFAAAAASSAQAGQARRRWADELGPYVLSVGGIEPRKGTDDLVEAMSLVQMSPAQMSPAQMSPAQMSEAQMSEAQMSPAHMSEVQMSPVQAAAAQTCPAPQNLSLVIGGGETLFDYRDYRDRVQARAAELGVRYRVLGPVADDRLPALMAQAAVFAFPSRKEGFGMAAMEALAAGVPVVMRDLPVLHEVFGSAVRFAADPATLASEITKAAREPDEVTREAGRALAASHRWSDAAQRHLDFYRAC